MIKKWKIAFITTILTFCISCCIVNANGIEVKSNEGLIPLRQAAENIGCQVIWNGEDNSVQIIKDNTNINIKINASEALISGKTASLSSAPVLINDKTYVTEDFFYCLPQIYITKTETGDFRVLECETPNVDNMMNTITELSKEPRGVSDETHENAEQYLKDLFSAYGYELETQVFDLDGYKDSNGNIATGTNIIATKKADLQATGDIFVFGAHYDGAEGFPAANDNGSGVSVLMEIARIIKDLPTDTEIRFVLFDAEELGLYGSKHYVKALSDTDRKNIIGMINFDMLGGQKAERFAIHTGNDKENYLFDILTDIPMYRDMKLEPHPFGMSDHYSFVPRVIPTLDISHESIKNEYHNENDLIAYIDENKLILSAEYGIAAAKKIMTNSTSSYMNIAKPEKEIGTVIITKDTQIDTMALTDIVSRHLGTELIQVESDDDDIKYMVYANLFGMDKTADLIFRGQLDSPQAGNPYIDFDNSGITFDEIKTVLDNVFGEAERIDITDGYYYNYKNELNGTAYNLFYNDDNSFRLDIGSMIEYGKETYALSDSGIIRMSNDELADIYTVSNIDGKITVTSEFCVPDENLEITEKAKKCFEKIKPYISSEKFADVSYIIFSTDGIGNGVPVRFEEGATGGVIYNYKSEVENPVPEEYKNLPEDVVNRIKTIPEGAEYPVHIYKDSAELHIDYLDFINENGNAYSEQGTLKVFAYIYGCDLAEQCRQDNDAPKDGTNFDSYMHNYDKNSFVYKFADMFYQDIFALDDYYNYDLFGENPRNYVCEEAANSLETDLAYSFAEFVASDKPVSNHIADKKVMFFYDYPEFVEMRTELRSIAGF